MKKRKSSQKNGGSSGSKERGNSRTSPTLWFSFTMFNYSALDIERFQGSILLDKYVFQEELCPTTNKQHLQGTVKFKKKVRLTSVNKNFPKCHWECTKSIKGSTKYCFKDETKLEGGKQWSKGIIVPEVLITIKELRPWQEKCHTLLKGERDDRTINWFWEETGNIGKSAFAKWLAIKHQAFCICGSAADLKFGLADMFNKTGIFPKIVILDIPRDSNGCSYKGLEQIKNGMFYSTKYESGMVLFNPPHVIIFANCEPDIDRMSKDRWNIVEICGPADLHGEAEAQLVACGSFADTDSD